MRHNPLLPLLLLLVAAIAVGDWLWPYGPFSSAPQWPATAVTREAVVTRQPALRQTTMRLVVRLTTDNSLVELTLPRRGGDPLSPSAAPTPPTVSPGDRIVFHAVISAPRNAGNPGEMDYAAYLRHQGVTGTAFCRTGAWRTLGCAPDLTLRERMLRQRERLVDLYARHFEGDALGVVAAMTLGDRRLLDRSVRELYSRIGASHVLALSGLHLSILVAFVSLVLLRRMGRWGRVGRVLSTLSLLVAVWAFVFLTGLPTSLVRAATMLSIMAVIRMLHHRAPPFHSLLLALILMLLADPSQLFDVGLQLSAVAVAAIQAVVAMTDYDSAMTSHMADLALRLVPLRRAVAEWAERRPAARRLRLLAQKFQRHPPAVRLYPTPDPVARGLRLVGQFVLVSLAAQLATMPLVAHYFGRISLVGLPASVVVVPIAYAVLAGTIVFLAVPPLRALVATLTTTLVDLLHRLLEGLSALPLSSVPTMLTWWGVAGFYALILWVIDALVTRRVTTADVLPQRRPRLMARLGVAVVIVGVTLTGEAIARHAMRPGTHIAIYNRASRMEIHCVTPESDTAVTPDSPWMVGRVLAFSGQRVAIVDRPFPYVADVALPAPLPVDVLLVTRGAKGHLADALLRYAPAMVALDGALGDYYRARFAAEALEAGLPVYDIRERGALLLHGQDEKNGANPCPSQK